MDIISAENLTKAAEASSRIADLTAQRAQIQSMIDDSQAEYDRAMGIEREQPIDLVPTDKPKRGRRINRAADGSLRGQRKQKPARVRKAKAERKPREKKAEKPVGERKPRVSTDDNATIVRMALSSTGEPASMAQLVEKTGLTAVQIRRAVAMDGSGISTTGAKRGTKYALD